MRCRGASPGAAAAPTFKGRFGFHPMFCFADATGETLSALLRPGNAGANTVADHVSVLDAAVAQLPQEIAAGHLPGCDPTLVQRAVVVRANSAGCTEGFLFPSLDFRYWGFYTNQDGDHRDLDVTMRAHAHVKQHICRLKDSGLTRFPLTSFSTNANWLMTIALLADLVRWFQLLCFDGPWRDTRPKALRWAIFHAPGRLVHRVTPRPRPLVTFDPNKWRNDRRSCLRGTPIPGSLAQPIEMLAPDHSRMAA